MQNIGNNLFRRQMITAVQDLKRYPVGKFFIGAEIKNFHRVRAVKRAIFSPKPPATTPSSSVTAN